MLTRMNACLYCACIRVCAHATHAVHALMYVTHGMCMWHVRMHAYMYACFDGLMGACLQVCMIEIVIACAAYQS